MKAGLDTNVLAYAEGINDKERHQQALQLIERLSPDETFVPVQVLGNSITCLRVVVAIRGHTRVNGF